MSHSPFPSTQVKNDESLVLVGVDVMEHADGRPFELVVDVLARAFPGNVEQGLQREHHC